MISYEKFPKKSLTKKSPEIVISEETNNILVLEKLLKKLKFLYNSYDYIKFDIASPRRIRNWSLKKLPNGKIIGEVFSAQTINFRTRLPEDDGLFCEKIFGPRNNWKCKCKKYVGINGVNKICENCEVELTEARVRRYRMGYIQLSCPIAHHWYFKGTPNYLLHLLKIRFPKIKYDDIDIILYFREGDMYGDKFLSYYLEKRAKKKSKKRSVLETWNLITFLYNRFQKLTDVEEIYNCNNRLVEKKLALAYCKNACIKELNIKNNKISEITDEDIYLPDENEYKNIEKKNKKIYRNKEELNENVDKLKKINNLSKIKKEISEFRSSRTKILSENTLQFIGEITIDELENLFQEKEDVIDFTNSLNYNLDNLSVNNIEFEQVNYSQNILEQIPEVRKGAEVFQSYLENTDIKTTLLFLKRRILQREKYPIVFEKTAIKQYRIFGTFLATNINLADIILTCIPVLPPTLRPFVEIQSGRLVTADSNEMYRLLIIRNETLGKQLYRRISKNKLSFHNRKLLQETLDSLINNARVPFSKISKINDKQLRGLTEVLEGKFGRFRHTLLGKRTDYSGRSVIIVNPQLELNECGIPYLIAKELFKPMLLTEIINRFLPSKSSQYSNLKRSNLLLKKDFPLLIKLLGILMSNSCIFLNRAPTLHKFGVQAFNPIVILGQAIQLHPLVCTGFNADFDGDQMAIHLPLSKVTQFEIKTMMRPSSNILSSANGEVILKPSQDIVIGCYYLTFMLINQPNINRKVFTSEKDVFFALYQKFLTLQTPILVRYSLDNFSLFYENNKFQLVKTSNYLPEFERFFSEQKIEILEIFLSDEKFGKIYFFTNIGIFFGKKKKDNFYKVTDLFFETTPGRIIFSNAIKKFFPPQ